MHKREHVRKDDLEYEASVKPGIPQDAVFTSDGEIEPRGNGKCIVQFKVNRQYYWNQKNFSERAKAIVGKLALEGINRFLRGLKEL